MPAPRLPFSGPLPSLVRHSHWGAQRSPFDVLGVKPDASEQDIRKAYFNLARKCHPDVYDAADAQQRFQEISNAYSLLIDEDQRRSYEAQAGLYQSGETSAKDLFDRVFTDQRFKNPILAVEERALYAVLEQKKGNDGPSRDFVVDYRLPPHFFLPRKPQLEAEPGTASQGAAGAPQDDESKNTIADFFSKSPISGGA